MKAKTANPTRLDILGNAPSDGDIFTARLKQWRQRLGYCSIFAAVPAILAAPVTAARSEEAIKPETSVAGRSTRPLERFSMHSSPALLKRQSQFRLPHQKSNFDLLAPLGGTDDCPGRTIPGGNYTAAAPYVDSGDTTGANDTVTHTFYINYSYYNYEASGPDHVYTFVLTGRGPNPQIQVATTSGTYRPLIYILDSRYYQRCPAGTGTDANNELMLTDSRWSSGSTAMLNEYQVNLLPLNVPLHLFVDSRSNDASGSGPYTIRMQDVTIAPVCPSSIDCTDFFVRQHYLDFLNRQPDPDGLAFWSNEIAMCGGDESCVEAKRINVSAAFFLSIEFQETGYLVYRTYKSAYGDQPGTPVPLRLDEFLPDTQQIGQGVVVRAPGWEQVLENNKQAFTAEFVQRSRFTSAFSTAMSPTEFVDALFANAGVTPSASDRMDAVNEFGSATSTSDVAARARALRRVAENSTLAQQEFNRAFVLMQYFGYLHRNPNDPPELTLDFQGYNFWLNKLNQFNGDYIAAEMVKSFLVSGEYRSRFNP